jgi:hypothetical protein
MAASTAILKPRPLRAEPSKMPIDSLILNFIVDRLKLSRTRDKRHPNWIDVKSEGVRGSHLSVGLLRREWLSMSATSGHWGCLESTLSQMMGCLIESCSPVTPADCPAAPPRQQSLVGTRFAASLVKVLNLDSLGRWAVSKTSVTSRQHSAGASPLTRLGS